MSATESSTTILRRLLDERSAEYTTDDGKFAKVTKWLALNGRLAVFAEYDSGELRFAMDSLSLTPEQAIAATLDSGECELHDCEGSFSALNRPVWRCDCGAFMTQYTDATTYHKPRFCPNCGRKAVSA